MVSKRIQAGWALPPVGRLLLAGCCLAASAAALAVEAGAGQSAEAAVREVVGLYAQGTYEGDAAKLNRSFHPRAVMNGYLNGQPLLATPEPFIEEMRKAPLRDAGAPYRWRITDVQVAGKVASATLKETGFPDRSGFINYFHLIDDGGGWRIISKLFAQISAHDKSLLLEAAGLPYSDGHIKTHFSEGYEARALSIRPLLGEAMDFYKAALGIESRMAIAVLDEDDWLRFADGIPYGLPFVSGSGTPMAFIPATGDGVLAQGAMALRQQASAATLDTIAKTGLDFDEGARAFVDAIALHELGHVQADAYGIQPASSWFAEFVATYFAYGFLREKHPDLARVFEIYAYRLNRDVPGPQVKTLARFEAEYGRMEAHDYAWYQGMFLGLAMRLYDQWGMKLLPTVQQRFPATSDSSAPAPPSRGELADFNQELKALAEISPAFQEWMAALP